MNASSLPVTVVIPTLNEEKNLQCCLNCLDGFEKIYVIDSGSTDRTVEIAEKNHIEVLTFQWDGHFPKKRNWFLRTHKVPTPWVFFLDADEYVTPEFKEELATRLNDTVVGFQVFYTIQFLGQTLKHFHTNKLPIFRVGAGEYEKIEENNWSRCDMEVHEHPVLNGPVARIKATIIHEDDKGLHAYIGKHNEYSSWEANRYLELKGSGQISQLFFRQKIKYMFLNSFIFAPLYFCLIYFVQFGFLDGNSGLIFSLLKKQYFSQVKFKIFALERHKTATGENIGKNHFPNSNDKDNCL